MSTCCALVRHAVFVVAIAGCASSAGAHSGVGTAATARTLVGTACAGFEQRYIGGGLSVELPIDVAQVSGEATSDPGPAHASESHDFVVGSSTVTVGRRIGSDVANEPSVSERVSNGVVLFAKASNENLRACLLVSMLYDRLADLADE
jgi:hypothetical protein